MWNERDHHHEKGLREKKKTLPNSSDEELIQKEPHGALDIMGTFSRAGLRGVQPPSRSHCGWQASEENFEGC